MKTSRVWDGLILIGLGGFLLAANQGWIHTQVTWQALRNFWPLALMIVGVSLIFRGRGPSVWVLLLAFLVLFTSGTLNFAGRWIGFDGSSLRLCPAGPVSTFRRQAQLEPNVTEASLEIGFGAGKLEVRGGASVLADARLEYVEREPQWQVQQSGSKMSIRATQDNTSGIPVQGSLDWRFSLASNVAYDLNISAGACSADLDLRNVKLQRLNLSTGASSVKVRFPEEPEMSAKISAGAASLELILPRDVGLRINSTNALLRRMLEAEGLRRDGDVFYSEGFATARSKLEIDLSAGATSVKIRRQ